MSRRDSHAAALPGPGKRRRRGSLLGLALLVALATIGVAALLVSIFERRGEARTPYVRLVEVDEGTSDPVPWGTNWPQQFDSYRRTVDATRTRFGGSSAMPESKLVASPWLRRLYAGYAFSLDYRERRGHAYMLYDQRATERVTRRSQTGACLHCHASVLPTYRRLGLEAAGAPAGPEALAAGFAPAAVERGFEIASAMSYPEAYAALAATPDGTPGEDLPLFPAGVDGSTSGGAHPVSCIDCHEPRTMAVRVTRPGFLRGIAALAESEAPVPHLPSVARWRAGDRRRPYDPNVDATRQEMRSYVCGQCHVEYYCASREVLFFPWRNGLRVEQIEATYDEHRFPDGEAFYDWQHGETGARAYKAQHPEFELWSQGVHAASGVSCADCHMPYERQGAAKVSSHWVRSPLLDVNRACQTCHHLPEEELLERVETIQERTHALLERAAGAMTDMLDAIREAQAAGAPAAALAPILELQRRAMWRLDFISSENSMGFHADQEAARILAESIDFSRQAQAAALRLRAPAPPAVELPVEPVRGVTPGGAAPAQEPPSRD